MHCNGIFPVMNTLSPGSLKRLMRVTVRRSPAMVDAEEDADIPAEEVAKR